MSLINAAWDYYLLNQEAFWRAARQHGELSVASLTIALMIGLPLGILLARQSGVAQVLVNVFGTLRVIPSLVILFLALPYLGLGFWPALTALTLLAIPPVVINTTVGIRGVDPATVEAAYAMGMARGEVLRQVQLPLASPAILAGVRTAAIEVISSATLAAFIGGGGLGDFITRGFALYDIPIMLVGAVPVAILALAVDALLGLLRHRFVFANS